MYGCSNAKISLPSFAIYLCMPHLREIAIPIQPITILGLWDYCMHTPLPPFWIPSFNPTNNSVLFSVHITWQWVSVIYISAYHSSKVSLFLNMVNISIYALCRSNRVCHNKWLNILWIVCIFKPQFYPTTAEYSHYTSCYRLYIDTITQTHTQLQLRQLILIYNMVQLVPSHMNIQ